MIFFKNKPCRIIDVDQHGFSMLDGQIVYVTTLKIEFDDDTVEVCHREDLKEDRQSEIDNTVEFFQLWKRIAAS